ncbi:2137_t:CDS:2, partial [Funneliformis geosporum]
MVKEPISTEPDITPAIVIHRRGGHGRGKDTGCENEGVIEASNKIVKKASFYFANFNDFDNFNTITISP